MMAPRLRRGPRRWYGERARGAVDAPSAAVLSRLLVKRARAVAAAEAAGQPPEAARRGFEDARDAAVHRLRQQGPAPAEVDLGVVLLRQMNAVRSRGAGWVRVVGGVVAGWGVAAGAPPLPIVLYAELVAAMARTRASDAGLLTSLAAQVIRSAADPTTGFTPPQQARLLIGFALLSKPRRVQELHDGPASPPAPLHGRGACPLRAAVPAGAAGHFETRILAMEAAGMPGRQGPEARTAAQTVARLVATHAAKAWLAGYAPDVLADLAWGAALLAKEGEAPSLLPLLCSRLTERAAAAHVSPRGVARVMWAVGHTRVQDRVLLEALCTPHRGARMGLMDLSYVFWGMAASRCVHRPFLKAVSKALERRQVVFRKADATAVCTALHAADALDLHPHVRRRLVEAAYTLLAHLTPVEAAGVLLASLRCRAAEHCRAELERVVRGHCDAPEIAAAYRAYSDGVRAQAVAQVVGPGPD